MLQAKNSPETQNSKPKRTRGYGGRILIMAFATDSKAKKPKIIKRGIFHTPYVGRHELQKRENQF